MNTPKTIRPSTILIGVILIALVVFIVIKAVVLHNSSLSTNTNTNTNSATNMNTNTHTPTYAVMDTAGWKTFTDTPSGATFKYPTELSARNYVRLNSVPTLKISSGTFSCAVNTNTNLASTAVHRNLITGAPGWCAESTAQGTAGTAYYAYTYTTSQNGSLVSFSFTIAQAQCDNYAGSESEAECQQEESNFNVDTFANTLLSTLQLQ